MQDIKTVLGETISEFKNAWQADIPMSCPWKGRQTVCLPYAMQDIKTVLGETRSEFKNAEAGRQSNV